MPSEFRQFTVSVAPGTTQAVPQLTNLTMPARIVRRVRVRIPRGPNGLMGFALASSGVPIIPWNSGAWVVADDEVFTWELENQIDSGAWQLRAYNTGAYAHSVYLTFEVDPPQRRRAGGFLVPIPVASIDPGSIFPPPGDTGSGGGAGAGDQGLPPVEPPVEPPPVEPPPVEPPPVIPPPDPADGYAIARANAVAAVQAALGDTITAPATLPPAPGTVARVAYDAGRLAALAALDLL